jgi:glycine/D-amino acid oxidase-like deaminating enzyme/nitrite reductase/ring-hydroxylating ferredoxin subunit
MYTCILYAWTHYMEKTTISGGTIMEKNQTGTSKMPQYPEPYWRVGLDIPSFPKLDRDIEADVAIVGAGISGITTAYLLAQEGLKVVLLEASTILNGTTGHTTAKITAQHDLIYDELIHHFGEEKARLYYQANSDALQFIKDMVNEHQIECDFTEEDAYIYANTGEGVKQIQVEYEAYKKLGIVSEYVQSMPLPLEMQAAIVMKQQAQFHPLKFLLQLVQAFVGKSGIIYENTTAVNIEKGERPSVITRDGYRVTCKHIVSCSHFPFYEMPNLYFTRMYAERSYVLGVKTEKAFPGGMYLSADSPKRSLRYTNVNGENLVLIGGESHKTGQGICTIKHYEALEAFGEESFGITEIPYRWSAQDLITLDKVPYIGRLSADESNIFVATGYRKWGMTNGTAAALLLRDLIVGRDNSYQELYSPSRFHADPNIKAFITINVDVAKHLIGDKIGIVRRSPGDLDSDEGAIVNVNGKRACGYRDESGHLHIVDSACTHMGCELAWNSGDRTWDCPCHGSRFSVDGDVIEGPAEKPLKRIELE